MRFRLTHGLQTQILIQFKVQQGLSRNSDLFALRQDLSADAAGGADGRANRRALTATYNGTDERAQRRTPTHHDGRPLVCAHALSALLLQVARAYQVPGSGHS